MHVDLRLLFGIVLAHALWAIAYITGTLLDMRAERPATRSVALLDLGVRTASGLALLAFGAFALAVVGWLNVVGLTSLLVAVVAVSRLRHGRAFFAASFWRDRLEIVGLAFGGGNLLTYYVALATIVPAALPAFDSDPVRYHLAYAMEWAHHGGLLIDRFLRQPLYANNFLLVFAALDVLHLENYVHFASWLCGALAMLAVRAALTIVDDVSPPATSALERFSRKAVTFIVPLSIVIAPVFLRWVDTGMVDVPIELYAFVVPLCAVAALLVKRDLRWSAVCCGAFAIGMKISLIAFAPLFVALVWILIRSLGGSRRAAAIAGAVMILGGSPWYVRNVIYDRDPVPPIVNLALHRPDLTYSPDDASKLLHEIQSDHSPEALFALPYRMWADPGNVSLREYGSTALSLFLYIPPLAVGAGLALGARTPRTKALLVFCTASSYGLVYCLMTSYLMRYLLVTQAPLAASLGAMLLAIPGATAAAAVRAVVAAISVIPTPSASGFYDFVWQSNYRHLEQRDPSDAAFLTQTLSGYPQTELLLSTPAFAHRPAPRALLVLTETDYYFRLAGVQTVGDWFGPGRFSDLGVALDNDRLADYLQYFDIGGVIVKRSGNKVFDSAQLAKLVSGLRELRFRILQDDPNGFLVAVRSEPAVHERREPR